MRIAGHLDHIHHSYEHAAACHADLPQVDVFPTVAQEDCEDERCGGYHARDAEDLSECAVLLSRGAILAYFLRVVSVSSVGFPEGE